MTYHRNSDKGRLKSGSVSETGLTSQILDLVKIAYRDSVKVWHIPNELKGLLKHSWKGFELGAPDLVVAVSKGKVLLMELKSESGTVRPEQKEVATWLLANEHNFFNVRSVEQFKRIIDKFLNS